MTIEKETHAILGLIRSLEEAANEADSSKEEAVLWLDDERFSEIEDCVPWPFGAERLRETHDRIRKHGKKGDSIHFGSLRIYFLTHETAYATAVEELKFENQSGTSRVTFLFLKQDGRWGVIHAHYSSVPEE